MDERTEARELLAPWALDAVDDVDRARIEQAIRQDPALAREARGLVETAARLAESGATPPPPALRAQVLTAVDSVPQQAAATPSAAVRPPRRPRLRVATWIVAAAVATMAVIAPSVLAVQQAGRAARAEQEVALLTEALAEPDARVLTADVAGGGRAVVVVGESGVLFTARGLPDVDNELGYQLWVIDGDAAVSAGVLEVSGGIAQIDVAQAGPGSMLALTVEPTEGSRRPTTDPIVRLPEPTPAATQEPPA